MEFFNIDQIFFELLGYGMSYLEFFAVLFGLVAVVLSAKANIWNWPVGIFNIILSGIFYYQIQLYPDMFLQVFFFITALVGWWRWAHPKPQEADDKHELKVSFMKWKQFLTLSAVGISGTFIMGALASELHRWFPSLFHLPSAFPYADSFILVMSVVTTFYVIQKKIEVWIIWIIVDTFAAYLYFLKGAYFFSFEYLIFTMLAAFGLWNWIREFKNYQRVVV
jgi:nicotinamide mononucleotide transporter